jgi:endonuclease/exonuclease/phosphatase family metal-dependent hydrolase
MRVLRPLLYIIGIPVGAFLLFVLYAVIDDYKPGERTSLPVEKPASVLADSAELNLLIWNIGFGGLDASMDFFYDGGKGVRPTQENAQRNFEGITRTLSAFTGFDFVLLQEVDVDSKRSYHRNQVEELGDLFRDHQGFFGMNWDVFFVPLPLSAPLGKVESGILSLSKHAPTEVVRHSLPADFMWWPYSLFMLDRCFLVERFPLSKGKELLVINTHNSAYDDGSMRKQQMDELKEFLLEEYKKGNYIIMGGDWNQTPYGFPPEFPSHLFDTINLTYMDRDYPTGDWTRAFDPGLPTNRRVTVPYERSSSLTTVIDYYLLSPNVELEEVETIDVDFQYSDHQPVRLKVRLRPG